MRKDDSIVVSSRVGMKELAELDEYWISQGHVIRSMSSLICWSCELLCSILRANGKSREYSVAEAYNRLEGRALFQKSNKERSFQKIGTAMRFESMKAEGVNVAEYVPVQEGIMGRKNAVQGMPSGEGAAYVSPNEADYEIARKMKEEEELANLAKIKADARLINPHALAEANSRGMVTTPPKIDKDNIWDRAAYEKEIRRKENAPLDLEWVKNNTVKE